MEDDKINILIIGSGFGAQALAKKLHQNKSVGNIYLTNHHEFESEFCRYIDIRDNDVTSLLKFVIENDIQYTVPVSEKALNSDIVSIFEANGQSIFGPVKYSCHTIFNKIIQKKFLYKIGAPIPKFAVFNKLQFAREYFKTCAYPLIVSTGEIDSEISICTTENNALNYTEKLLNSGEADILVQDYVFGNTSTVYFITDGYSILPINSTRNYIFKSDDDAKISQNVGCYSPDYRITQNNMNILNETAKRIISEINKKGTAYVGILGIEFVTTNNNEICITNLINFIKNTDAHAVLNSVEDDLIKIFNSCINGYFSDEYTDIKTNDLYSVSVVVNSLNDKLLLEYNDDLETENVKIAGSKFILDKNSCFMITKSAPTLSRARELVYDTLSEFGSEFSYRNDIGLSNLRI